MNKSEQKSLVPKLRFREFQDAEAWKLIRLGDIADFFKGKGLPKSSISIDGVKPCIRYGELFTKYSEVIYEVSSRTDQEDCFLSVCNDVLMPTSDVTPNGLARASCIKLNDVVLGGDILVIRTQRSGINGEFLSRYIKKEEKQILKYVAGVTVYHLYRHSIENLSLSIPFSKEQQKIADCLSSIDQIITIQSQKLDLLKTHKKGLIQKLFPAEGKSVPELRFPEFRSEGAWAEEELGNICEFRNNCRRPISSNSRKRGIYPYYGASGVVDYVNGYIYDERLLLIGEDGAKWGSFETTAFIAEGKYWVNNHAHVVKPRGINDTLLENYLVKINIEPYTTGSAPPKLTLGKLKQIPVQFPLLPKEQKKIADCLSTIDDLITAQGQKLNSLEDHKKGLMQQMFPVIEESVYEF